MHQPRGAQAAHVSLRHQQSQVERRAQFVAAGRTDQGCGGFDALFDAQAGYYDDLINLIAECVYPEDPVFAIKFLSKRKLTDDLLEEAKQMARAYDAPTVLCTLFDAIHCEA